VALPEVELTAHLPLGFRAGAATAGIKASGRPDLAIVATTGGPAAVAATFTTNRFPSAPVLLNREHLTTNGGRVAALLSTSGCANAATGDAGLADQRALADALALAVGASPEQTLAVATGLIGPRLPVDRVVPAIARLVGEGLREDPAALADVAEALRTTDSRAKWATVHVDGGVTVSGIAKGVGMIHPRMATMLAYVLTDAAVEPEQLRDWLGPIVSRTWNQLTVDGDTSTSDTVFLVASGASAVGPTDELRVAIEAVARSLARQQASDGEGATSLVTCQVTGAGDDVDARAVARSVVSSSLVKTAIHGRDPNWGRIADAIGNAQVADAPLLLSAGLDPAQADRRGGRRVDVDPARVRIRICEVEVFAGVPVDFDPGVVRERMHADEIVIGVDLGAGTGAGEAFGCDLTEAYVRENSEYST
jgi:glutamate N-acetyltransferase/amino-acid N-acetyltransferase